MDTHVRYGYSMYELQEIARITVLDNRHRLASGNFDQAIEIAWEGVVEALLTADQRPERNELMFAGWSAVSKDQKAYKQMTGVPVNAHGTGSQFARYWQQTEQIGTPEGVVDPIALRTIWPRLTDVERQVLKVHALADHSPRAGAEMLGLSVRSYESKLRRARERFKRYWFEGETPRPIPSKGVRRPGAGFATRQEAA